MTDTFICSFLEGHKPQTWSDVSEATTLLLGLMPTYIEGVFGDLPDFMHGITTSLLKDKFDTIPLMHFDEFLNISLAQSNLMALNHYANYKLQTGEEKPINGFTEEILEQAISAGSFFIQMKGHLNGSCTSDIRLPEQFLDININALATILAKDVALPSDSTVRDALASLIRKSHPPMATP